MVERQWLTLRIKQIQKMLDEELDKTQKDRNVNRIIAIFESTIRYNYYREGRRFLNDIALRLLRERFFDERVYLRIISKVTYAATKKFLTILNDDSAVDNGHIAVYILPAVIRHFGVDRTRVMIEDIGHLSTFINDEGQTPDIVYTEKLPFNLYDIARAIVSLPPEEEVSSPGHIENLLEAHGPQEILAQAVRTVIGAEENPLMTDNIVYDRCGEPTIPNELKALVEDIASTEPRVRVRRSKDD